MFSLSTVAIIAESALDPLSVSLYLYATVEGKLLEGSTYAVTEPRAGSPYTRPPKIADIHKLYKRSSFVDPGVIKL
jgi:hypothetical protein